MELHTPEAKNTSESLASTLSADLVRILEAVRKQLEVEFEKRLEASVREAEKTAKLEAEKAKEQAVEAARTAASEELGKKFEQDLKSRTAEILTETTQRIQAAQEEWSREKQTLREEMGRWRRLVEAQRFLGESDSQKKCLQGFLDHAQAFSPAVAVYVSRRDGLALWSATGGHAFPPVISRDTMDPAFYFKPVVIRGKIVAAVCAVPPFHADSFDLLLGALSRAIEAFGLKLENRPARPDSPPVLKSRASQIEEKAIADARFIARMLVADVKLHHEAEIRNGRENSDLYARLKDPIEKARQVYCQRVSPTVLNTRDLFHELLIEVLAEGEPQRMGEDYPGPQLVQRGTNVQQTHLA